jgi:hypothetical protein
LLAAQRERNRRRDEAFLTGSAAALQAAAHSGPLADVTVASLLQAKPQLIDMVASFIRSVGQHLLAKGHSVIHPWVSGGLDDEDPALYAELLKKSKGAGFSIATPRTLEELHASLRDKQTPGRCAVIVAGDVQEQADGAYLVKGYWCDNNDDIHIVSRRLVLEGGQWRVP